MDLLLAAAALIVLHNVDGNEVLVNPQQIVALTATNEGGAKNAQIGQPNAIIAKGHRCVVALTNGKFVSVQETCDVVARAMESAR